MIRLALACLILAAVTAAGAGGYWIGHNGFAFPGRDTRVPTLAAQGAAPTGPVIYYRDPDARPVYSLTPKNTEDGRPFRPVRASEDVSFDPPVAGESARADASGPRKLRFYRNPMGLPDTSSTPKKDSMGMDYIPVYEGDENESGIVKISPGKLQRTGVRTAMVSREVIRQSIRAPGSVALDERRQAVVAARVESFVVEVANVTTGDRVVKGQPLVSLISPEVAVAAALFVTELNGDARATAGGGARRRLENLGAPPEGIAEIERTRRVPRLMTWTAPRDGIVLDRNVTDGMRLGAGETMFRIIDISTIWVMADVPEFELAALRIGATAQVKPRHRPDLMFEGRVTSIYPKIVSETRTARIRMEVANPGAVLLPNMYVDVDIATGDAMPQIVVPRGAVIDTGTRQLVLVDRGEGRFEPRDVKIGVRGETLVAILDGLVEGDRIVVAANFLIDAESNLQSALNALQSGDMKP